jgi:hypothetical protein
MIMKHPRYPKHRPGESTSCLRTHHVPFRGGERGASRGRGRIDRVTTMATWTVRTMKFICTYPLWILLITMAWPEPAAVAAAAALCGVEYCKSYLENNSSCLQNFKLAPSSFLILQVRNR